jgi:hypothetical protein
MLGAAGGYVGYTGWSRSFVRGLALTGWVFLAVGCVAGAGGAAGANPTNPGAQAEAPPPRTALSDGGYCLNPTDGGFQQVSCATGKPFPNGDILADSGKVCFEIDKRTRTLLPIPCADAAVASAERAPGQGPTSILPPLPPGHIIEKPLVGNGPSLCTEDTADGLKMLVECSKIKGKAPPAPPPTLKLCERLIGGVRYVVPCE